MAAFHTVFKRTATPTVRCCQQQ